MTPKPLIIGFDQTRVDDTGVCVIEYHPTGGGTPLYTDTVKGIKEIHQVIQHISIWCANPPIKNEPILDVTLPYPTKQLFPHKRTPAAIAIEDAFFSAKTPRAAESGWVSRGWIEAFCELYFPGIPIYIFKASEWRFEVFGSISKLTRDQWKYHVGTWADAKHPGFFSNNNETDAYGIACACGAVAVREGVIT